jgi:hypothetical protein
LTENPRRTITPEAFAGTMRLTVVLVVVVWHFGYDIVIIARGWDSYQSRTAVAGAWLALAGVQIVGSVLLLRDRLGVSIARGLSVVAFAAGAVATFACPPGQALSDVSWAWNSVGWFAVLLLLDRPLRELLTLSAANTAVTALALALDGSLDRVTLARFLTVAYATAGVQVLFGYINLHLRQAAQQTRELAAVQAEQAARLATEEAVHAGRQQRYGELRDRAEPLLHGLAESRLDPADPVVQRAAGIEASRLRRLFAETDDTAHPLLHELRACADLAERRDVNVTIHHHGDLPALPAQVRRHLTEAPLVVLVAAVSWARLTVVADREWIVVSALADAPVEALHRLPPNDFSTIMHNEEENELWVESTWPIQARR